MQLSWLSIANWLIETHRTRILIDGYITRLPGAPFFYGGGGGFAFTRASALPDVAAIRRVHEAIGAGTIDFVMTSHSHWDHGWDTAVWAKLSGAPVIGSLTTAYQCVAQGVPASQCRIVVGGEAFDMGNGVMCHVIRTNHSGDAARNPEQHNPVELRAVPTPDSVTGGLRGGVAEDFPNGGGGRAYLFTVDDAGGRLSVLYTSSLSAVDLDVPVVVDGVDYGAPRANFATAMASAGLEGVDLWIGVGGAPVADLLLPVVNPRVYIPNHWDGLFNAFEPGLPFPFSDQALEAMLASRGIVLLPQRQYMDAYRLDASGVVPVPNRDVKRTLGFSEVQTFPAGQSSFVARPPCCR